MGRRLTAKDVQYFKARASSPSSSLSSSPTSPSNKKSSLETLLTTRYGRNATLHFDDDDTTESAEEENTNINGQHLSAIASIDETDDNNVVSLASPPKTTGSSPLSKSISNVFNDYALQKRAERIQHALSQAGVNDAQHLGGDHPIDELHLHLVLDDDVTHVPVIYTTVHHIHHHNDENNTENEEPAGLDGESRQKTKSKTGFWSRLGNGGIMQALFPSTTASTTESGGSQAAKKYTVDGKDGEMTNGDVSSSSSVSASSASISPSSGNGPQSSHWVPGYYLYSAWSGVSSAFYGSSASVSTGSSSSSERQVNNDNGKVMLDDKTNNSSSRELSPS